MNIQNMEKKQVESFPFRCCGWNNSEKSEEQGSSEEMLGLGWSGDSGVPCGSHQVMALTPQGHQFGQMRCGEQSATYWMRFIGFLGLVLFFFYFCWRNQLIKIFSSGN